MGEYASFRNKEVKLGTCELMYYITLGGAVSGEFEKLPNSLDVRQSILKLWFAPPAKQGYIQDGFCDFHSFTVNTDEHVGEYVAEAYGVRRSEEAGRIVAAVRCREKDGVRAFRYEGSLAWHVIRRAPVEMRKRMREDIAAAIKHFEPDIVGLMKSEATNKAYAVQPTMRW